MSPIQMLEVSSSKTLGCIIPTPGDSEFTVCSWGHGKFSITSFFGKMNRAVPIKARNSEKSKTFSLDVPEQAFCACYDQYVGYSKPFVGEEDDFKRKRVSAYLFEIDSSKKSSFYGVPSRLPNVAPGGGICFGDGNDAPRNPRSAYNMFWGANFNKDYSGVEGIQIEDHRNKCKKDKLHENPHHKKNSNIHRHKEITICEHEKGRCKSSAFLPFICVSKKLIPDLLPEDIREKLEELGSICLCCNDICKFSKDIGMGCGCQCSCCMETCRCYCECGLTGIVYEHVKKKISKPVDKSRADYMSLDQLIMGRSKNRVIKYKGKISGIFASTNIELIKKLKEIFPKGKIKYYDNHLTTEIIVGVVFQKKNEWIVRYQNGTFRLPSEKVTF